MTMAKASGGTRINNPYSNIQLIKFGKYDSEDTDDIHDFYLPKGVVSKFSAIDKIDTYEKAKEYLQKLGINLSLGSAVSDKAFAKSGIFLSKNIIGAVETYRNVFGSNALSKLKNIVLYDKDETSTAAYYFNKIGEKDPKAGSIHIKSNLVTARQIFHELAHAYQDSHVKKGEDAISYSNRVVQAGKLSTAAKTYSGADSDALQAERFADAFANAFAYNKKYGLDFINNIRKYKL